jgi:hypothetical protein
MALRTDGDWMDSRGKTTFILTFDGSQMCQTLGAPIQIVLQAIRKGGKSNCLLTKPRRPVLHQASELQELSLVASYFRQLDSLLV